MKKVIYYGCGFEITLRELLFSIAIVLLMLTMGFFISEKIASATDEANQEYYQAIKIEDDEELFAYGMRTGVGNAFVSGTLEAVDPVTYEEIGGEYAHVKKVREEYTRHTRTVEHTTGKTTYYTTEIYYTWDAVSKESVHCTKIRFCGTEFDYGAIEFPGTYCAKTINESSDVRYKYYVRDTSYHGTIYAKLSDNTISDASFMDGMSTDEAMEQLCSSGTVAQVLFWILWIFLAGLAVYGFCYLDNRWLED